jgi:hypothetical protein
LPDRGGESGGDGEKPKRKKERTRLWFSCCSGDRGKMCFGFEKWRWKGQCAAEGEWSRESLKVCVDERLWAVFLDRREGKTLLREGEGL